MNRRQFLAATGSGGLGLLSGCIFRQNSYPSFTAAPVSVPAYIRKQTGFTDREINSTQTLADVSYNNETRTIETNSWATVLEYEQSSQSEIATVLFFSTPSRQIGSETLSPGLDSSVETVVETHVTAVTDMQLDEDSQYATVIETLGVEQSVFHYDADISYNGYSDNATVYTTVINNSADKLLLVGIQSQDAQPQESEFLTLFQSVIHPYEHVQSAADKAERA